MDDDFDETADETAAGNTWVEAVFGRIESAHLKNKLIVCRISEVKNVGFLVKINGLFAFLTFKYMPWQYSSTKHWHSVAASLEGKTFFCKVLDISRVTMNEGTKIRIFVDASMHRLGYAELQTNVVYTGIILQKFGRFMVVETGCCFNWRCGSITGIVPIDKFTDLEAYQSYEAGQTIDVMFEEHMTDNKLFAEANFVRFRKEHLGTRVMLKARRDGETGALSFLVEDRYKTVFDRNQKPAMMKNRRRLCENGDMVEFELLNFSFRNGFVVRWIKNHSRETDWCSDEMHQYLGKRVDAVVHKSDDGVELTVENKYPARLPDKFVQKYVFQEGMVLNCEITSINFSGQYFVLRVTRHRKNTKLYNAAPDNIDGDMLMQLKKKYEENYEL
jgi:ribosomal protein S1